MTEKNGKKKLSRRDIINRNAFKAGGAAARLRKAIPAFNELLFAAARAGILVDLKIREIPDVTPSAFYIEADLTRGKRQNMKVSIIQKWG